MRTSENPPSRTFVNKPSEWSLAVRFLGNSSLPTMLGPQTVAWRKGFGLRLCLYPLILPSVGSDKARG